MGANKLPVKDESFRKGKRSGIPENLRQTIKATSHLWFPIASFQKSFFCNLNYFISNGNSKLLVANEANFIQKLSLLS